MLPELKKPFRRKFASPKTVWPDETRRHLKAHYHLWSLVELAEFYGKTITQVKAQASRQYLTKKG